MDYSALKQGTTIKKLFLYIKAIPKSYLKTLLKPYLFTSAIVLICLLIFLFTAFNSRLIYPLAILAFIFMLVTLFLLIVLLYFAAKNIKLENFCRNNNFTFDIVWSGRLGNGLLFKKDGSGFLKSKISGKYNGRDFWFGNYIYGVYVGAQKRVYAYGVIAVKLPKNIPNIFIDSKKQSLFSQWYCDYNSSQKYELEGDFNNYFNLYVPPDYERDTLYFLTPELMQLLVDEGKGYALEVIDGELIIYNKSGAFSFDKPELTTIFKLINTLGGNFNKNTTFYQDVHSAAYKIIGDNPKQLQRTTLPRWANILIATVFIIIGTVIALNKDKTNGLFM